jgi:hypothetical protein
MSHSFEAALDADTVATAPMPKVRLLTLNFTALTWDFERAKATGRTGLATDNFSITARFKPFLPGIRASFSVSKLNNPLSSLIALFSGNTAQPNQGAATSPEAAAAPPTQVTGAAASGSVVSGSTRERMMQGGAVPSEFNARIDFTLSRQRPPTGDVTVIENVAAARCQIYLGNALLFDACLREAEALSIADPNAGYRPPGGAFIRQPTRSSVALSLNTPLTTKWSASWTTSYDFEVGDFASHMVNLNREMHDWNATISFTQSPAGSFMFSFLIALKAQPEIKIDYQDVSYSAPGR